MGKRSPQEVAERLGARIREQDLKAGRNTSQGEAQKRAADLLNQADRKRRG